MWDLGYGELLTFCLWQTDKPLSQNEKEKGNSGEGKAVRKNGFDDNNWCDGVNR